MKPAFLTEIKSDRADEPNGGVSLSMSHGRDPTKTGRTV